jgi:hypothetical protein
MLARPRVGRRDRADASRVYNAAMTTRAATRAAGAPAPAFVGFHPADYQVFRIKDFAAGMAALRARVTPKLGALGESLAPKLTATLGEPFHAHVAKHARRTVNTPHETWVAFGRDPRKYKAFAFLGLVAHAKGLDARLVLKDEAMIDKRVLADALRRERDGARAVLAGIPGLAWYQGLPGKPRAPDAPPIPVADLPPDFLDDLADSLRTRKSAIAEFGVPFTAADPRLASAEVEQLALRALTSLHPLYRLATRPRARVFGAPGGGGQF